MDKVPHEPARQVATTSERLKRIMNERNLKQIDILNLTRPYCEKFGVKMGKSDMSQFVSGKVQPGQWKLTVLGLALNVSEAWLMGLDVPMERGQPDIDAISGKKKLTLEYEDEFELQIIEIVHRMSPESQKALLGFLKTWPTTDEEDTPSVRGLNDATGQEFANQGCP